MTLGTPMDELRAARNDLKIFADLHPILRHHQLFELAQKRLDSAINRLEVAIGRSVTVANVERHLP